jgi:hypothetical protein
MSGERRFSSVRCLVRGKTKSQCIDTTITNVAVRRASLSMADRRICEGAEKIMPWLNCSLAQGGQRTSALSFVCATGWVTPDNGPWKEQPQARCRR